VATLAELVTSKIPPHSLEAERAVLGAILLEPDSLPRAVEILKPADFYKEGHRQIFRTMLNLFERSEPVDLLTVSEELRRTGELDEVGGPAVLASLVEEAATAAHLTAYAEIVRKRALLRELIRISTEIIGQSYEAREDVDTLLDQAEQQIFQLSDRRLQGSAVPIRSILKETFEYIETLYGRKERVTGLPTGFDKLDELTSGLQPSDFIIVAGRPSMGKSAFALNVAKHVAIELGKRVLVLSLEMAAGQVVQRLLCAEARVDSHRVRTGSLEQKDWLRLTNAAGRLSEAPIFIDDTPGLSGLDVRAKARRVMAEHGLDLVVLDYIQLMRGRGSTENRQQEISEISRALKAMAKELRVPVVALSQLSRAVETRPTREHRPQLSDHRECVTGENLVVLADGRRVPVRELVGTAPEVLAVSPDGRIVTAKSERIWLVGLRRVFSVRLASGRVIRATEVHRLLAARGWRTVSDLSVGDRVAMARRVPEPAFPDSWPDLRVALLGQLIGDGSYLSHQPLRYTTSSEENSRIVAEAVREEFGCDVKRYAGRGSWHQLLISGNGNRWHPGGLNGWLRRLGIFGERSYEKRVPEAAFRLPSRQIALLLRHLWATDGTITPRARGKGSHGVFYGTNSPRLASDVAALLLRLNIVARISSARKGHYRPSFFVTVSGATDQRCFLEAVGAFGPRVPQAERLRALLADRTNTNVDTLPAEDLERVREVMRARGISQRRMAALRGTAYGGSAHFRFAPSRALLAEYAEILQDEELNARATSDLFWDRIVAIEPDGEEEVFDLTVPGPASWLADGIVSHNSGALEQDADLIIFLYRPERYKEQSEIPPEQQNLAEVIIGKQRNGPTGTVLLTFKAEYASFEKRAPAGREPY
jgi:replicative DNA helicase